MMLLSFQLLLLLWLLLYELWLSVDYCNPSLDKDNLVYNCSCKDSFPCLSQAQIIHSESTYKIIIPCSSKNSSRLIHNSSFVSFFKINRAIMKAIGVINLTIIGTVKELTSIKLIAFSKFSSVFFINFTLVWNITIFGFVWTWAPIKTVIVAWAVIFAFYILSNQIRYMLSKSDFSISETI